MNSHQLEKLITMYCMKHVGGLWSELGSVWYAMYAMYGIIMPYMMVR